MQIVLFVCLMWVGSVTADLCVLKDHIKKVIFNPCYRDSYQEVMCEYRDSNETEHQKLNEQMKKCLDKYQDVRKVYVYSGMKYNATRCGKPTIEDWRATYCSFDGERSNMAFKSWVKNFFTAPLCPSAVCDKACDKLGYNVECDCECKLCPKGCENFQEAAQCVSRVAEVNYLRKPNGVCGCN